MLSDAPVMTLLPCVDVAGARNFYGGVLGLKEVETPGFDDGTQEGMVFQCGEGTRLAVYQRATATTADHTAAGWIVDDFDSVADALLARGVKFEVYDMPGVEFDKRGVATMGTSKAAWFKDPEGNILSIADFS